MSITLDRARIVELTEREAVRLSGRTTASRDLYERAPAPVGNHPSAFDAEYGCF
jgi:hypothetical protein